MGLIQVRAAGGARGAQRRRSMLLLDLPSLSLGVVTLQPADTLFRREQWDHRFDAHVLSINHLVDALRAWERGSVPYVAPMYGGIDARLLSILRDPGPMTQLDGGGSGFLLMENDDATAEAMSQYFSESGISAKEIVPWNIYPWYINRAPSSAEIDAGLEPLRDLIELLPKLCVVMLRGGSAKAGWNRFLRRHGNFIAHRAVHVIETYHTSRQAFWHREVAVREKRRTHLRQAFADAAQLLAE
jgi:hypothetical protein